MHHHGAADGGEEHIAVPVAGVYLVQLSNAQRSMRTAVRVVVP
jgi:hypothetical protein